MASFCGRYLSDIRRPYGNSESLCVDGCLLEAVCQSLPCPGVNGHDACEGLPRLNGRRNRFLGLLLTRPAPKLAIRRFFHLSIPIKFLLPCTSPHSRDEESKRPRVLIACSAAVPPAAPKDFVLYYLRSCTVLHSTNWAGWAKQTPILHLALQISRSCNVQSRTKHSHAPWTRTRSTPAARPTRRLISTVSFGSPAFAGRTSQVFSAFGVGRAGDAES